MSTIFLDSRIIISLISLFELQKKLQEESIWNNSGKSIPMLDMILIACFDSKKRKDVKLVMYELFLV